MHNEARAIKMSYLACCLREMGKSHVEKNDNGTAFIKFLLKARDSDMFPVGQVDMADNKSNCFIHVTYL